MVKHTPAVKVGVMGVTIPKPKYIPEKGDIIFVHFDPLEQVGREIAKDRPAVVVSDKKYNQQSGYCIVCPIGSTVRKGYPFNVELDQQKKVSGAVMCDQIKSIDWQERSCRFMEHIEKVTLQNVMSLLKILMFT